MTTSYEQWLSRVGASLNSINMAMADWQRLWPFDFQTEYHRGATADDAATKANRYWWKAQHTALNQACHQTTGCWLPREHQGACEPV